jgi:NAD dependent epimerase/dehydratase
VAGGQALVTGAGGFIASHLVERLVREGLTVRALCRYTSRQDVGNLADIPDETRAELDIVFGDLLDRDFVAKAVAGCDTVFHLAASISVPYSFVAPRQVVLTNVEGTLNVLTATLEAETSRVVHLSSSEVYGTAQYTPIDEAHPLHVQSPYAASKVGADKLAESFFLALALPVVIARPFNTFGPRQSARAVIPTVLSQLLAGADELRLGDLTPKRDFTFVTDTAEGFVRAAVADLEPGATIQLGTGRTVSVAEVVELCRRVTGSTARIVTDEQRLRPAGSEVQVLLSDPTRAAAELGWRPTVSLEDGLAATAAWLEPRVDPTTAGRYSR